MNIEVRCYKCGDWTKVHACSLRWIRCPSCHKRVWLDKASKRDAITKESVDDYGYAVPVEVPEIGRGGYVENWRRNSR